MILNATHEKQAHNLVFSVAKRIGKGASLFKSIISGISSKVDQLGGSFIYFKKIKITVSFLTATKF